MPKKAVAANVQENLWTEIGRTKKVPPLEEKIKSFLHANRIEPLPEGHELKESRGLPVSYGKLTPQEKEEKFFARFDTGLLFQCYDKCHSRMAREGDDVVLKTGGDIERLLRGMISEYPVDQELAQAFYMYLQENKLNFKTPNYSSDPLSIYLKMQLCFLLTVRIYKNKADRIPVTPENINVLLELGIELLDAALKNEMLARDVSAVVQKIGVFLSQQVIDPPPQLVLKNLQDFSKKFREFNRNHNQGINRADDFKPIYFNWFLRDARRNFFLSNLYSSSANFEDIRTNLQNCHQTMANERLSSDEHFANTHQRTMSCIRVLKEQFEIHYAELRRTQADLPQLFKDLRMYLIYMQPFRAVLQQIRFQELDEKAPEKAHLLIKDLLDQLLFQVNHSIPFLNLLTDNTIAVSESNIKEFDQLLQFQNAILDIFTWYKDLFAAQGQEDTLVKKLVQRTIEFAYQAQRTQITRLKERIDPYVLHCQELAQQQAMDLQVADRQAFLNGHLLITEEETQRIRDQIARLEAQLSLHKEERSPSSSLEDVTIQNLAEKLALETKNQGKEHYFVWILMALSILAKQEHETLFPIGNQRNVKLCNNAELYFGVPIISIEILMNYHEQTEHGDPGDDIPESLQNAHGLLEQAHAKRATTSQKAMAAQG